MDDHTIALEKASQQHENEMKSSAQLHEQEIEKIKLSMAAELNPIVKNK